MPQTTIGELLRRHWRAAGFNQKELAQAIGYDHSLVSRIETGNHFPPQVYIERLNAVEALALSGNDRQEILAVYQRDSQARRSSLTEGSSVTHHPSPAQVMHPSKASWLY